MLTDEELIFSNEEETVIRLGSITQISHGFDELYTRASVKNFGAFWQPVRICYGRDECVYIIAGSNQLFVRNAKLFAYLKALLV